MDSPLGDRVAIVGLGNPGREYERTRHNVGQWVLDRFADEIGAGRSSRAGRSSSWREKHGCLAWRGTSQDGLDIHLIVPRSYMNVSGGPVSTYLRYFQIPASSLVVLHDELDLALGVLKLKRGGSAAGHRGVADVVRALGSPDFYRVRLGIGRPKAERVGGSKTEEQDEEKSPEVRDWVLGVPRGEELKTLEDLVDRGSKAVKTLIVRGLEAAQQSFH